jgi:hypothetical protein
MIIYFPYFLIKKSIKENIGCYPKRFLFFLLGKVWCTDWAMTQKIYVG